MFEPLTPILGNTRLFLLNSNHEMYSGGKWYFRFLDQIRQHSGTQQQEGSYFVLRSNRFQVIGIDTAYHRSGRVPPGHMLEWLTQHLVEGRQSARANILLSADHPYEYGENGRTKLLKKDLRTLVDKELIDMWFWGNTHYCALFSPAPGSPFIGSCIGHGGFPYKVMRPSSKTYAEALFVEHAPRFPRWTKLRQDLGNNGYCVMSLRHDGSVDLKYIDWMSNKRAEAKLTRDNDRLRIEHHHQFSMPSRQTTDT